MYQVFVDGEKVFKGLIRRIGGGGTKTAYQLLGTEKVILLPNEVDGQKLVNMFERICNEEVYMYNYLKSINLLGLPVTKCVMYLDSEANAEEPKEFVGLYAPSFESFTSLKAHVIDKKNLLGCTWDPQSRFTGSNGEVDWVTVFQPLYADLIQALQNGLSLRGDSFNLLLAEQESPYYCGTGLYALRYFGFDFASKRAALISPELATKNYELQLENCDITEEAKRALVYAIDVVDCLIGQPIVSDQYKTFV